MKTCHCWRRIEAKGFQFVLLTFLLKLFIWGDSNCALIELSGFAPMFVREIQTFTRVFWKGVTLYGEGRDLGRPQGAVWQWKPGLAVLCETWEAYAPNWAHPFLGLVPSKCSKELKPVCNSASPCCWLSQKDNRRHQGCWKWWRYFLSAGGNAALQVWG